MLAVISAVFIGAILAIGLPWAIGDSRPTAPRSLTPEEVLTKEANFKHWLDEETMRQRDEMDEMLKSFINQDSKINADTDTRSN